MYASEFNKETGTKFAIKCKKLIYKTKSNFQNIKVYQLRNILRKYLPQNIFTMMNNMQCSQK